MINKLKPIVYSVGAVSIVSLLQSFKNTDFYTPLATAFMFLHTAPILCNEGNNIAKDRFKVICYAYSVLTFILSESVIALLLLNIFQSFTGVFNLNESEAKFNKLEK